MNLSPAQGHTAPCGCRYSVVVDRFADKFHLNIQPCQGHAYASELLELVKFLGTDQGTRLSQAGRARLQALMDQVDTHPV